MPNDQPSITPAIQSPPAKMTRIQQALDHTSSTSTTIQATTVQSQACSIPYGQVLLSTPSFPTLACNATTPVWIPPTQTYTNSALSKSLRNYRRPRRDNAGPLPRPERMTIPATTVQSQACSIPSGQVLLSTPSFPTLACNATPPVLLSQTHPYPNIQHPNHLQNYKPARRDHSTRPLPALLPFPIPNTLPLFVPRRGAHPHINISAPPHPSTQIVIKPNPSPYSRLGPPIPRR